MPRASDQATYWHAPPRPSCRTALLALAPFLLAFSGCGGAAELPAAATGKVSYRGQPLPHGTIVFTPDTIRGGAGLPVRTEIQPDGSYRLKTADAGGLSPGWYRVTVAAVDTASPPPGTPPSGPRSLLPVKYRDPEQSGLLCEVKAGKENAINFNLE
ncbi:MAG: hypothetical protein JNM56_37765 [Planctomycetia bacterium]|nr:hypothetical protein [Planctomycetia bacterium]